MTEFISQSGLLGSLGIKGGLFVAQLINFLVILFIVWRWIYRPLLRSMDERGQKIALGLRQAEEAKTSLREAQEAKRALLKEADRETQTLIKQAHADAERQRQAMLLETRQEIERHVEQARLQLKEEREATMKAIKGEVAGLVLLATQKVLGQSLNEESQTELNERTLADFERTVNV